MNPTSQPYPKFLYFFIQFVCRAVNYFKCDLFFLKLVERDPPAYRPRAEQAGDHPDQMVRSGSPPYRNDKINYCIR